MGQAKNRGTLEQRIQQSKARTEQLAEQLGLEQRSLADIKADLGIPEDAAFHGYAVHIPEADEFLMNHVDNRDSTTRQWAKRPELAKCFEQFADSYRLCRPDRGEIVVGVFETESQYFVAEVM